MSCGCCATRPIRITGDGNVGPAIGGQLYSVSLTGGSDAATLALLEGGSGGTTILTIKAAINTTVQVRYHGMAYTGQLYANITGTDAEATVEL